MCGSSHGVIVFMQAPLLFLRRYQVSREGRSGMVLSGGEGVRWGRVPSTTSPASQSTRKLPMSPSLTLVGGYQTAVRAVGTLCKHVAS